MVQPLGSAPMRKQIFLGLTALSLATVVSAAQRGGAAPAMAPAIHTAPAAAVAHAPVPGNHFASPHGPAAAHPAAIHTGTGPAHPSHVSAATPKGSALPHKPATAAGFPVVPNPLPPSPLRPGLNIPGYLPGDIFSGQSCYFGNCYPVPGLGFDYTHFFAVHPNWGKFQFGGVVLPGGWGGGFYYPVPYYTEPAPQEGQQENASAAANPQESNVAMSAAATEEPATTTGRSYSYPPLQPVEEYVFVKRDGTRIFAVAYSLAKDKLQYVTKEGLRRTLPLDLLDYDATIKSNEERGNSVTLPGAPPAAMAMAM
jgi:hypothetical protein